MLENFSVPVEVLKTLCDWIEHHEGIIEGLASTIEGRRVALYLGSRNFGVCKRESLLHKGRIHQRTPSTGRMRFSAEIADWPRVFGLRFQGSGGCVKMGIMNVLRAVIELCSTLIRGMRMSVGSIVDWREMPRLIFKRSRV